MAMIDRIPMARGLVFALFLVAGAALSGPAHAQAKDWGGLEQRPSKKVSALYVRPGASLKAYKRVRLEPLQVAFDKNWRPNDKTSQLSQKMGARDFERIKSNLATGFEAAFKEELSRGGYTVVSEADDDVLTVVPFVVDLSISAPKTNTGGSPTHTFVAEQGRMTLVAELRDSSTNQVLARAVDKAVASQANAFQMANDVTRSGAADDAIRRWARALRSALDEAKAQGS
jgi:uncharacterized protein DUF3313